MKKLFMAVAVMLLVGGIVKAQKLELGDKDEYIRYESSLLGMDENNYYVLVGYSYNKKDNYKGTVLYTYDKNLKIVDKTNIDDKTRKIATESFVSANKIAMVHADQRLATLDCHVIDKKTKQCTSKQYFYDDYSRKETAVLRTCKSPDDSLFFAMKTIFNDKDKSIRISKMVLFDNELNELWQKDYFAPAASMFLSNDGEIFSVGYLVDDKGASTVRFSMITGDNEVYFDETISDMKIGDIEIANYNNGELLLYGLIQAEPSRRHVVGRMYYSGLYTFTYNIKTQTIGKINKYAFTTDDYRIFENLNPKRKCDDKDACFLQALDVLHTKDGGAVVAYNLAFETLLKSQYGTSKYKNMGGVMLWRLKPDGTILWNNGFKRNMATGMFENSWYTPHYITDNDEVVFVIETHKKDVPDNTSMANVVVKYYRYEQNPVTGSFPSNITLVRFDKNGNITKEAMPGEKKMLIVGNPNVMDDGKAVLLYVSNKKAPGGLIRMDLK